MLKMNMQNVYSLMNVTDFIKKFDISVIKHEDIEINNRDGITSEFEWYFPSDDSYGLPFQMLRFLYALSEISELFEEKYNVFDLCDKQNFSYTIKVNGSGNIYNISDWKGWYIRVVGCKKSIRRSDRKKIETLFSYINKYDGCILEKKSQ